jgi:hypothetical protein
MQLKSLVAAAALAVVATGAFAADQTVSFGTDSASFIATKPVLDGGDDVITFDNIAAGTYDFTLTLSGQYINLTNLSLNGVVGNWGSNGKIAFGYVEGTGTTPFVLTLTGNTTSAKATYSGELTINAVPEPETYALLLAGLGAVGFMARRRRA